MVGRPLVQCVSRQAAFAIACVCILTGAMGCSVKQSMPKWMNFSPAEDTIDGTVEIDWETSFPVATQKSKASGKPMLVWFTGSDWCRWCIKLDEEVFQTPEFQQWSSEKTVPIVLDYPKSSSQSPEIREQNERLKQQYGAFIRGYPSVLFVSSTGSVIGQLGYVRGGPENWIEAAENVLNRVAANADP